ncbi:MAG: nucleotide pyrophosphohydrolase [Elusimicrobia bacterium RIFCSPLOWO2_01_FULL_54_10]|nr:MAG: nucleotide pyrophosphohydrolase [Elusimicrobia bacterium RIFCSPLOWO2_01_FULL_54_10]
MDSKTTVQDLKAKVQKFCDDRSWDHFHNAKDLAIGIITEASELLVQFRFKSEEEVEKLFKSPKTREAICDEVVDILHTVLRFSQKYGIDLTTELERKMKKNGKKYPIL